MIRSFTYQALPMRVTFGAGSLRRLPDEVAALGLSRVLVLCSPEIEAAVARLLYEGPPPGERELFLNLFAGPIWLRPGIEMRGYVAAGAAPR